MNPWQESNATTVAWRLAQRDAPVGEKVADILSHVFFLPPLAQAVRKHKFAEAYVVFLVLFTSLQYHVCADFGLCPVMDVERWADEDHFTAPLLFLLVAMLLTTLSDESHLAQTIGPTGTLLEPDPSATPPSPDLVPLGTYATLADVPLIAHGRYVALAWVVVLTNVAMSVIAFRAQSTYPTYVAIGSSLLMLLVYVMFFRRPMRWLEKGRYVLLEAFGCLDAWFVAGLLSMGAALACFVIGGPGFHTAWHILIGVSIYCLMRSVWDAPTRTTRYAVLRQVLYG